MCLSSVTSLVCRRQKFVSTGFSAKQITKFDLLFFFYLWLRIYIFLSFFAVQSVRMKTEAWFDGLVRNREAEVM